MTLLPILGLVLLALCLDSTVGFLQPHQPPHSNNRGAQRKCGSILGMLSVDEAMNMKEACGQAQGVLLDLTAGEWGLLSVTGEDRLRFLHNQLTNSFTDLKPGQVLESSYTSSTGRTIDLVTAYVLQDEVLLLSSPSRHEQLLGAFNKYIFPLDRVEVQRRDLSGLFIWLGPASAAQTVLPQLLGNDDTLAPLPGPSQCQYCSSSSFSMVLAEGTGVALSGYTILALRARAASITAGAVAAHVGRGGMEEWQALRVLQGRPYPDKELTMDVTPLEAGLWHTVDFEKGCYLGQETLAKQANNKGERQKLYAVRGKGLKERKRVIDAEGNRAGVITSCMNDMGLAYIRKTVLNPTTDMLFVDGETQRIQVLDIPYATRAATFNKTTTPKEAAAAAAAVNTTAADVAAEAERKAKKLEEMKRRLEAFQAKSRQT